MPDRLDLVAAGHRPAAILNTDDADAVLARAAAAGLAALRGDPVGEDRRGRLAAGRDRIQVYIASTPAAAARLRDLDRAVRDAALPEIPRESHALGVALGYPDCCAWAYPHTAFEVPGEGEDVRWARSFAWRAGPGRIGPWSPWLNFHAARVFGLEFFEHLPCCPWCKPTEARNRRLTDRLHDGAGASRVREALSQSVVLWPDGRFLPFLCTGVEEGVLSVAEAGVPRGTLRPHFAGRALTTLPAGLPAALRVGRRGWEGRLPHGWRPLAGDGPAPVVLAFSM
jgi:hypothetical protein